MNDYSYMSVNVLFLEYCKAGNIELIKDLINHIPHRIINEALINSCLNTNIEIIKLLLPRTNLSSLNVGFCNACSVGNLEIIKLLLERGVSNSNSGFLSACIAGKENIVLLLLEKPGIDIKNGIQYACLNNNINIVKILIKHVDNFNNILTYACIGSNMNILKFLIDYMKEKTIMNTICDEALLHLTGPNKEASLLLVENGGDMNFCYVELEFDDIYYLFKKKIKHFGMYEKEHQKCKEYEKIYLNILQEIFNVEDVVNFTKEF